MFGTNKVSLQNQREVGGSLQLLLSARVCQEHGENTRPDLKQHLEDAEVAVLCLPRTERG